VVTTSLPSNPEPRVPAAVLDTVYAALRTAVRGEIRRDEPLARHTTFRVGGPADLYLLPEDEADLQVMLRILAAADVPTRILGNGSNVLAADLGFRGAIIRLCPHCADMRRDGTTLLVGAGAQLGRVVRYAAEQELSGLESTMGIPGTIGGALVMNAGTDFGNIGQIVAEATFFTLAGDFVARRGDELGYGYRESVLQSAELVVLSARLRLEPGEPEAIRAKMARLEEKRTSRQPTECRTAGSTFKNPSDIAAGKLIDRAGCKGHRIGGAEVSPKHANFIIAHPGATAADVHNLANWMHRRVREEHDRDLEMEIELLGDWSGWVADEAT
jgi:UDP-N-acetylmuramate dehydrogenase